MPIINFVYKHGSVLFHGDISSSNELALHNTRLLRQYTRLDTRVAPLGLAIKKWAKVFNVNDAAAGTLSSYALTIMLIHYLQNTEPAVLPSLQDGRKFELSDAFEIDGWEVRVAKEDSVEDALLVAPKNKAPLGALFCRFFDFYADFNFDVEVVVRPNSLSCCPDRRFSLNKRLFAANSTRRSDAYEARKRLDAFRNCNRGSVRAFAQFERRRQATQ